MFKSKTRPLVLPQSEHARLAGLLAYHWGNADFDRPALDFASFVKGVAEHDRGYGVYDNAPIDGVSRRHATISYRDNWLILIDHNSTNGTFLNGHRLVPEQPRVIRDKDTIRVGGIILHVAYEKAN